MRSGGADMGTDNQGAEKQPERDISQEDPGTNQQIARGTYLGQKVITPQNTSKTLTDAAVQTELLYQISAGNLPAADLKSALIAFRTVLGDYVSTGDGITRGIVPADNGSQCWDAEPPSLPQQIAIKSPPRCRRHHEVGPILLEKVGVQAGPWIKALLGTHE